MYHRSMNKTVSIKVDAQKLDEIKAFYADKLVPNEGEYVYFMAETDGVIITGFSGKKAKKTVTFVGNKALEEAHIWDEKAELFVSKEIVKEDWIYLEDQIGSDEVGVGDFLLPMIVVASFVSKADIKVLKELGVHDSKKLTDAKILEIGEELTKRFHYSKLTLSNEKYNEMVIKGENINSLKAKMHNRALLNMHKQYEDVINIFVDQFVSPDTYYKYLDDANEEKVKDITFRTKGESYFPCVALSSVIARYAFLKEKEVLEKKYKMDFPFGAGSKVDAFAKEFVNKYGLKELEKIAKINFANYRILITEKLV